MHKILIIFFLSYCVIACNRNTLKEENALNAPPLTVKHADEISPPNGPDKGVVYFPHKSHASAIECNTCHSGASKHPNIDQSTGHGLCLECHRQKRQGPVECSGCHIN